MLFAVLCGAAPISRPCNGLCDPQASPTLPLAASLGCDIALQRLIGIHWPIEIAASSGT